MNRPLSVIRLYRYGITRGSGNTFALIVLELFWPGSAHNMNNDGGSHPAGSEYELTMILTLIVLNH